MTTMDQIHRIRELFYEQGKNLNEIAIIMNCDWRTVRKYVDMEDFSSPPPAPLRNEEHSSKLDPFKPQIDSWMEADKLAPRKQRHTAKRIYKRLMDILVSRNLDSGNMETGIPKRKPSLIGLIKTHKKSNECQAQSRFAGHKPALHL